MRSEDETREIEVGPSSGAGSTPRVFADLDRRTQREAERSLAAAAFLYAAAYTVAFSTGWALHVAATGTHFPVHSFVVAGLAIAGALAMGFVARRGVLPPLRFELLAEIFAVLGSLGIAAAGGTSWRSTIEEQPDAGGLSWIGVWILAFPNVVTLCPGTVLRIGLWSALSYPAMYFLGLPAEGWPVIDGQSSPAAALRFLANVTIPVLVCTGIATYMSMRIFRLARDVAKARRLGNYQLVELLGRGGMGEVWKAHHRLLARPAAVKLIRADAAGDSPSASGNTVLRRFEREAQATAALTSPHTVAIYDFGITEDGTFYYVMELLEGMDLRTLVEKTGPVPTVRAARFLRHACASLADAHCNGLIHRDVKPANLFLCRRGLEFDFVKVLDFGLVKGSAETPGATQLTAEGIASGTPAFMAPEMALGGAGLDARVDLYALGCVAYWLLTGRLVFEGPTAASLLVRHAKDEPTPPSRVAELPVDPELERLVLDLLAKDPAARPASAREVGWRLQQIEDRLEPWTQERAERWWRAHLPHLATTRVAPVPGVEPAPTVP